MSCRRKTETVELFHIHSGGATPRRARSNDLAGRSTALAQALAQALPSSAYCFASVIVWTENKNVTISDRFICFILTVKGRWRLVFWGRQLKKGCQLFCGKKVHPGDLAGGFSDFEMIWLLYCAGAATAYPQTGSSEALVAKCVMCMHMEIGDILVISGLDDLTDALCIILHRLLVSMQLCLELPLPSLSSSR